VYKTSKKHGQQIQDINEELLKCIDLYLKFHPKIKGKVKKTTDTPFLVGFDGNPLAQVNSMTKIFNKIFGKKISSSALRHIFLSDKYGSIVKDMKNDAEKMGHTVETQKDYIKNI
jgi:integrase